MRTHKEVMATKPAAMRAAVKRRAKEMAEEELSLGDLRKAHEITQVDLAKKLKTTQGSVSQIENASDLFLSTLRKHIEAMGGELKLVASFPNRRPVTIAGLDELSGGGKKRA